MEVQPRMSIRIDFGIGRETSGFNFNKAFYKRPKYKKTYEIQDFYTSSFCWFL